MAPEVALQAADIVRITKSCSLIQQIILGSFVVGQQWSECARLVSYPFNRPIRVTLQRDLHIYLGSHSYTLLSLSQL